MTAKEAIETLRANYPDACYEQLREAVDAAIEALKARDTAGDTISRQAAIDALKGCAIHCATPDSYHIDFDDAMRRINMLSSAQPEQHEIGYSECANAMLKMWIDNVLTDGEYNRIMDKLNAHWAERREG